MTRGAQSLLRSAFKSLRRVLWELANFLAAADVIWLCQVGEEASMPGSGDHGQEVGSLEAQLFSERLHF